MNWLSFRSQRPLIQVKATIPVGKKSCPVDDDCRRNCLCHCHYQWFQQKIDTTKTRLPKTVQTSSYWL